MFKHIALLIVLSMNFITCIRKKDNINPDINLFAEYVFVNDGKGNCILTDIKTGAIKWKVNFPNSLIVSSPNYSNGLIFIGVNYPNDNNKSKLVALDFNNGTVKWEFKTEYSIRTCPIISKGKVIFTQSDFLTSEATLYCLNTLDGELIWNSKLPSAKDSSPLIKDDLIYVGGSTGMYIVDFNTGKSSSFLFKNLRIKESKGEMSYLSSPCYGGNDIFYFINQYTSLFKYNIEKKSQSKLFQLTSTTLSSPTANGNAIIINSNEELIKFNTDSQTKDWVYSFSEKEQSHFESSPIVENNSVFVVGKGWLYSVNFLTGKENWKFGNGIVASPVYYDQNVFVSSYNKLLCIDAENGKVNWSIPIENYDWILQPSPIVIDSKGKVFHSGISGERQ